MADVHPVKGWKININVTQNHKAHMCITKFYIMYGSILFNVYKVDDKDFMFEIAKIHEKMWMKKVNFVKIIPTGQQLDGYKKIWRIWITTGKAQAKTFWLH
jgi:hypothetical protein